MPNIEALTLSAAVVGFAVIVTAACVYACRRAVQWASASRPVHQRDDWLRRNTGFLVAAVGFLPMLFASTLVGAAVVDAMVGGPTGTEFDPDFSMVVAAAATGVLTVAGTALLAYVSTRVSW